MLTRNLSEPDADFPNSVKSLGPLLAQATKPPNRFEASSALWAFTCREGMRSWVRSGGLNLAFNGETLRPEKVTPARKKASSSPAGDHVDAW